VWAFTHDSPITYRDITMQDDERCVMDTLSAGTSLLAGKVA
jgi:hypothetical protein